MMTGEQMINNLLLAIFMFILAAVFYSMAKALDDRTPEQKERDRRAWDKKHWCEHKCGPCGRIENYVPPYRRCMTKCDYYRMSKAGMIIPKSYRDVHGDE